MAKLQRTSIKRSVGNGLVAINGGEVIVPTNNLQDSFAGEVAYIERIRIQCDVALANASGAAISNEDTTLAAFRALGNLRMRIAEHDYYKGGVDGEDALLHSTTRAIRSSQAVSTIATGASTKSLELVLDFARPYVRDEYRGDHMIPVAALSSPDSVLAFTPTGTLGVTGLTATAITNVTVWFDVVMGDKFTVPTPWALVVSRSVEELITLYPVGALEYLSLVPRYASPTADDTSRLAALTGLGLIDLTLDSESVFRGYTPAEIRNNRIAQIAEATHFTMYDTYVALPIISSVADSRLTKLPRAAAVSIKIPSRTGELANARFVHFETGERNESHTHLFGRAVGIPQGHLEGTSVRSGAAPDADRILPGTLWGPGANRFASVEHKARRRARAVKR